jgi:ribosomal-protein-alanine N-acetyltransferase
MIRKATIKDARGVAEVLKESYNIASITEGRRAFLSEMKKGKRYIVAVEKGRIIGIVSWMSHGLMKHGLTELDRIAVMPEYRGKGVSKQLFDGLVADARKEYKKVSGKLRKLYLLTHATNTIAHRFYERMGLRHETTLKNHYYNGENERVYSMFF